MCVCRKNTEIVSATILRAHQAKTYSLSVSSIYFMSFCLADIFSLTRRSKFLENTNLPLLGEKKKIILKKIN